MKMYNVTVTLSREAWSTVCNALQVQAASYDNMILKQPNHRDYYNARRKETLDLKENIMQVLAERMDSVFDAKKKDEKDK